MECCHVSQPVVFESAIVLCNKRIGYVKADVMAGLRVLGADIA
jgi:hypothetical protein